jgi:hypothetical protein
MFFSMSRHKAPFSIELGIIPGKKINLGGSVDIPDAIVKLKAYAQGNNK